jgi:hypothetical protein
LGSGGCFLGEKPEKTLPRAGPFSIPRAGPFFRTIKKSFFVFLGVFEVRLLFLGDFFHTPGYLGGKKPYGEPL